MTMPSLTNPDSYYSEQLVNLRQLVNVNALLQGDKKEILRIGELYSRLNNLPLVPPNKLNRFLAGKPEYLTNIDTLHGMVDEDARRCLYDIVRTEKLIRGIVKQIQNLKQNGHKKIHVVEAGGGTGILAIVAALKGAEVTFIEINPNTIEKAQKLIAFMGLEKAITIVEADATEYIPNRKIDLLICECLHTGLALEPQLQILLHLDKHMQPHGKILPEGVNLRWALADVNWENIEDYHTELRYIHDRIYSQGKWADKTYIDFTNAMKQSEIANVNFLLSLEDMCANTVLIEMDILVNTSGNSPIIIKSGEAEFLGHPHAIRFQKRLPQSKKTGACYLWPVLVE